MEGQTDGQTDGRTPGRYIDPAWHTMRAVPVRRLTVTKLAHTTFRECKLCMRKPYTYQRIECRSQHFIHQIKLITGRNSRFRAPAVTIRPKTDTILSNGHDFNAFEFCGTSITPRRARMLTPTFDWLVCRGNAA